MSFEFKNVGVQDTLYIKAGTLKETGTFDRYSTNLKHEEKLVRHRVFEDKEGRKYVQIFLRPKLQMFVGELFSVLEFTPVRRYKDEKGKLIYLSVFPTEKDFTYDTAGKVKGWAKFLILNGLMYDNDHYVGGGMYESVFREKDPSTHNANIFLGNMLPFDYSEAYKFPGGRQVGVKFEMKDAILDIQQTIKEMFTSGEVVEYLDEKRFYLDVLIVAESMLKKFKQSLQEMGVDGIERLLKKLDAKSFRSVFLFAPKEYSAQEFMNDMLLKIFLLQRELLEEIMVEK